MRGQLLKLRVSPSKTTSETASGNGNPSGTSGGAATGGAGENNPPGAANGPRTTLVSGDAAGVGALVDALVAEGVFARLVKVTVASHSAQMDPLLDATGQFPVFSSMKQPVP